MRMKMLWAERLKITTRDEEDAMSEEDGDATVDADVDVVEDNCCAMIKYDIDTG